MPTTQDLIEAAARELRPLLNDVIFVGGATVGLLLTDQAAEEPRVTFDVDLATHAGRVSLAALEGLMHQLGFMPDMDGPICRWEKGPLVVDLMSDSADAQGFTNPWCASASAHAQEHALPSGARIRVMDAPHLVATKLAAWRDRGKGDLFSHDLEDILVVVDGRPELAAELANAPRPLREFVQGEFATLLAHPDFGDTVLGFCREDGRQDLLLARFRAMADA